jgi:hypothetical protein
MKTPLFLLLLLAIPLSSSDFRWGFHAHKKINETAVFLLPPEMFGFYKANIQYLTEAAVNPDKRRYMKANEAECHFIDLDRYTSIDSLPKYWNKAVEKFTEDTLRAHGIVPWHINKVAYQLTEAFKRNDKKAILRISADLGHYVADANVPLHTTSNYNGQLTNQHGIHGFWESRLPELYSFNYDFLIGKAEYVDDRQQAAWSCVRAANLALDSVLQFEKLVSEKLKDNQKYTFYDRNGVMMKSYSEKFSGQYHNALAGQVERRMRASIKMVAAFWYTCWVDAGQPVLMEEKIINDPDTLLPAVRNLKVKGHED